MSHFAKQIISLMSQKHSRLSSGTSSAICSWWNLIKKIFKAKFSYLLASFRKMSKRVTDVVLNNISGRRLDSKCDEKVIPAESEKTTLSLIYFTLLRSLSLLSLSHLSCSLSSLPLSSPSILSLSLSPISPLSPLLSLFDFTLSSLSRALYLLSLSLSVFEYESSNS